ncbi:MAG: site-specific DNA-methyltransferase [Clostridiales bacterium]|nr:site-specific DNA-methyltransferase [Clostridiales bacterium]
MNCIGLLERFTIDSGIGAGYLPLVMGRINEFNDTNEDKADVDYDVETMAAIIADSFKLNSENLKVVTDFCVKKNIQIGRRHKKILMKYLNYRNDEDLQDFFNELAVENTNADFSDIKELIYAQAVIDYDTAVNKFLELWGIAENNRDRKKISDYLFGLYSKLHANYNSSEMNNMELLEYNLPLINGELSDSSITELKEFCEANNEHGGFYDKYVQLLRRELQEMSQQGKLEKVMNQTAFDENILNHTYLKDRKGDLHYLTTEEYDAVYLRLSQQIYEQFDNVQAFYNYILDAIQQCYRALINNKVFAVEIDNIYVQGRNIKWLLYAYIGVYAERFIRTEEKRKFYAADKICKEMFKAYGIEFDSDKEKEIASCLKTFYNGKEEYLIQQAAADLKTLLKYDAAVVDIDKFLDEWRYVYYGFSFNDCLVIRGTLDEHPQYSKQVKNDNKLLFIFYKYRMDERRTPCPVCNGLDVSGNSYPEIGHRSWECKNVICKSRSKSNRGKRYSFKTNYMQFGTLNLDAENVIEKEMIAKWRKDISYIASDKEIYEMFMKYFSFPEEKILFINAKQEYVNELAECGRTLINMSLIADDEAYTISSEIIKIDTDLFNAYFERGAYLDRFFRDKKIVQYSDEISRQLNPECDSYIINEDAFEALSKLEAGCIAAAVTSPPYFNSREYSQWENMYLYYIDMYNIARNTLRTLDKAGIFLYNIGDVNGNEMTIAKSNMGIKRLLLGAYSILAFEKAGYELVDNYVWNKGEPQSKRSTNDGNFTPHYQKPVNCYEHMLIFKRRGDKLEVNEQMIPEDWKNFVVDFMPVFKINSKGENIVGHTAPYPEDIPQFAAMVFGKADKYIMDPFLGSGTSIVSAVKCGYKGIGIEVSKEYAELAKRRFTETVPDRAVQLL